MELRLTQKLKPTLGLQQIIDLSRLLALPLPVIDSVIDSVGSDPERAEGILTSKRDTHEVSGKTQAPFGYLVDSKGREEKSRGGLILSSPLKCLELIVGQDKEVYVSPDVTYIGRLNQKPTLKFAPHLDITFELKMKQIPPKFREANRFYSFLIKERKWITSKLQESYLKIGEKQREFISTLDPATLNIYAFQNLADDISLAQSTAWRLLNDKNVLIVSSNEKTELHPARHLMPTSHDFYRHQTVPKLNEVFSEEFTRRTAHSDQEIEDKTKTPRRTIAKYRGKSDIPIASARKTQYSEGRSIPFVISSFK